ncbi:DUF3199 family protein [bacterium]|nr:DUF3199 family protein [bacterium]
MAHTYNTSPFDNISKVRLLIGDTDIDPTTDAQFSDEEINVFLTMAAGSILTAAGYALEAWASAITDSFTSEKIGDYSYAKKNAENKVKLAKEYKEQDAAKPYLTWAEMDLSGVEDTTIDEDIE